MGAALAVVVAVLALAGATGRDAARTAAAAGPPIARAGPAEPAHTVARALALAGPRPAASRAERRAHDRVARAFAAAGLAVTRDRFRVPGRGRSRNVIGIHDTPARCLTIVMAHADSVPPSPGAEDNASGVGVVAALAPRLAPLAPRCDVWLVATGAEERPYTGQTDHLGSLALVRRVRREARGRDLRLALSVDEVGHGRTLHLRSPTGRPRRHVERAILRAARDSRLTVRHVPETSAAAGLSDHREFGMAGLPAAKLGVPANPCRHATCDRARRLDPVTLRATRRLVERLLSTVPSSGA